MTRDKESQSDGSVYGNIIMTSIFDINIEYKLKILYKPKTGTGISIGIADADCVNCYDDFCGVMQVKIMDIIVTLDQYIEEILMHQITRRIWRKTWLWRCNKNGL